jgi:hypothetical protein
MAEWILSANYAYLLRLAMANVEAQQRPAVYAQDMFTITYHVNDERWHVDNGFTSITTSHNKSITVPLLNFNAVIKKKHQCFVTSRSLQLIDLGDTRLFTYCINKKYDKQLNRSKITKGNIISTETNYMEHIKLPAKTESLNFSILKTWSRL